MEQFDLTEINQFFKEDFNREDNPLNEKVLKSEKKMEQFLKIKGATKKDLCDIGTYKGMKLSCLQYRLHQLLKGV
jgi:hypothetical protein